MRWSTGKKIGTGFALALAILVVIGTVSYRNTVTLTESADWVAHTHRVLEKLQDTLSELKDTETGQRGYLITGEERYLQPYNESLPGIKSDIDEIRQLTADNASQQRRLDTLEPLVSEKLTITKDQISVRKQKGLQAVLPMVLTDKG